LALVRDGDTIELDVEKRRLHLDVTDEELAKRRQAWKPAPQAYDRGYARLYVEHVMQAHQGADLDFLVGKSGAKVARESH
jgi:dihydroxy-acid dehydratase